MSSAEQDHVIVVGSGLAGLSASLAALRAGAGSVVLLERAAKPGGNSIKASSGINGAPTRYQSQQLPGAETDDSFFSDTIRSCGERFRAAHTATEQPRREKLITVLTNNSRDAVHFLADELGVDLSHVTQLGGHNVARTHRGRPGALPPGAALVSAFLQRLKQDERFELRTGCDVTRLLVSAGKDGRQAVTGVEYRVAGGSDAAPTVLRGPVVVATGGFAGDAHGLLAEHRADLKGMPSSNSALGPGFTSAHKSLLTAVGAKLVDMDSVQVHPTGFVDPADPGNAVKFLAAEGLRGEGGILLHRGVRFVNEMETRDKVSAAIMDLPRSPDIGGNGETLELRQWDVQLLLDHGAYERAESHVSFYLKRGLMVKKRVGELDATTKDTINKYSAIVAGGEKDPFGRTAFGYWRLKGTPEDDDEHVYIGTVTPLIHFTMGGVVIDEKSRVMESHLEDAEQTPIEGLWAAGEVTGGIHGDNRLGGSSLLECVVFGRIAGEEAAGYLLKKSQAT